MLVWCALIRNHCLNRNTTMLRCFGRLGGMYRIFTCPCIAGGRISSSPPARTVCRWPYLCRPAAGMCASGRIKMVARTPLSHYGRTAWAQLTTGGGSPYTCVVCHRYSQNSTLDTIAQCIDNETGSKSAPETSKVDSPLHFPFEGKDSPDTTEKSETRRSTGDADKVEHSHADEMAGVDFKVEKVHTPEGRFYRVCLQGEMYEYPSVTTVLKNTPTKASYFSLQNWRKNMIKEHGESGYRRIRDENVRIGKDFHKQLETRLLKHLAKPEKLEETKPTENSTVKVETSQQQRHPCTLHECTDYSILCDTFPRELEPTPPSSSVEKQLHKNLRNFGFFQSMEHVLEDISDVHALESVVTHMKLGYTGTCDCIAKYKGELCVIDWKTSSKPRPSLSDCYEYPLQTVAYAGAVNQDPHYPIKVYSVLIVVAYPSGEPAHTHLLTHDQCQRYWQKWLARVEEYHTRFAHDFSNVHV